MLSKEKNIAYVSIALFWKCDSRNKCKFVRSDNFFTQPMQIPVWPNTQVQCNWVQESEISEIWIDVRKGRDAILFYFGTHVWRRTEFGVTRRRIRLFVGKSVELNWRTGANGQSIYFAERRRSNPACHVGYAASGQQDLARYAIGTAFGHNEVDMRHMNKVGYFPYKVFLLRIQFTIDVSYFPKRFDELYFFSQWTLLID